MKTKEPHGIPGHVNAYVRDHESVKTGKGKHARVIAFQPQGGEFFARVDLCWTDLREPTVAEVLTAARLDQGIRGKWNLKQSTRYAGNGHECIQYDFTR